jgi:DNA processing protein
MNNKNNNLVTKLRIYRTENIGTITYKMLINKYGINNVIDTISEIAHINGKKDLNIPSVEDMELEINNHHKIGAKIIQEEDEYFPREILDFPPILSVLGNQELLTKDIIAVIGTRLPSLQGMQYTKHICEILGNHGYIITSGFAKGIDTITHEASLKTGTIAILPCGINVIFPSVNMFLYNKIQQEGLLITDRPFHQQARAQNFPQRNKLLAALSLGVIVTEATLQSGSLMTANFSRKLKKPVFSVPGHPLDMRYSGNNNIIKNGGILIDKPQTIIDYLHNNLKESTYTYPLDLHLDSNITPHIRQSILHIISMAPISVEDICIYTNFSLGEVNYVLLELEIIGKLERLSTGQVCLK